MPRGEYLRFKWSHQAPLHRAAARVYNGLFRRVPFGVKYPLGRLLRGRHPPYSLLRPGDQVVQIGAPQDTLLAGRSRAFYFSLFVGPTGRVLVVEPDADSAAEFERVCNAQGVRSAVVRRAAAWSEQRTLTLHVDRAHPATNFTDGCVEYAEERLRDFATIDVEGQTVDALVAEIGMDRVRLLSITTNGAEREILKGARETMRRGLRYVSLARTGPGYESMMQELGYKFLSHDDRGYTFEQIHLVNETGA